MDLQAKKKKDSNPGRELRTVTVSLVTHPARGP